jgi:4-carboxymuconolactone decarboxylase
VAALMGLNRLDPLRFHLNYAVPRSQEDELIEAIMHLAFYSGWPKRYQYHHDSKRAVLETV